MFRRKKPAEAMPLPPTHDRPGVKGRPTRTRKEAEAAARDRARAVVDKKAARKLQQQRRADHGAKLREAMRTGDERYLPKRDKGPVKRFIRDFVDSRLTVVEFLLPLLLVIWFMQASGNPALVRFSSALWTTTLLVVAVDLLWMMIRLRRALRARFPDESTKKTTLYTLMRVVQVRPLRQPKPQVRIGGKPK